MQASLVGIIGWEEIAVLVGMLDDLSLLAAFDTEDDYRYQEDSGGGAQTVEEEIIFFTSNNRRKGLLLFNLVRSVVLLFDDDLTGAAVVQDHWDGCGVRVLGFQLSIQPIIEFEILMVILCYDHFVGVRHNEEALAHRYRVS